ncbi:MAG TPA: hypothetical protein VKP30_15270 [Polyangiaceae bacterium]|nr:hypothetical protein [Polyangiaceae bacterium]
MTDPGPTRTTNSPIIADSSVTFSREYVDYKDGEIELRLDVRFPLELAPLKSNRPTFSIEYIPPPEASPKNKAKPKTPPPTQPVTYDVDAAGSEKIAGQTAFTSWSVSMVPTVFNGRTKLTVTWIPGTDTSPRTETQSFSAGNQVNEPETITLSTVAPQICRLINSPTLKNYERAPEEKADPAENKLQLQQLVTKLLAHVVERLDQGLGTLWRTEPALPLVNGRPLCEVDVDALQGHPGLLEEAWAQALTEYLTCTPYVSLHNYSSSGDAAVFANAITAEPSVPITFACQQLATMSAIARGIDGAAAQNYDASDCRNLTVWSPAGTKYTSGNEMSANAGNGIAAGSIRPGSVYVASSYRHIAFVLRTLTSGRVQLLDTGAMHPRNPSPTPPSEAPKLTGNYDTHAIEAFTTPIKHTGKPGLVSASSLASGIRRLRQSRPMGLARLLVLSRACRDDNLAISTTRTEREITEDGIRHRLLYVSPWLPMWSRNDPSKNYPITRLMWSLRNHPFCDKLEARWQIDIPQGALYRSMALARTYSAGADRSHMPVLDFGTTPEGYVRPLGKMTYVTARCTNPACPNSLEPRDEDKIESFNTWTDFLCEGDEPTQSVDRNANKPNRPVSPNPHAEENRLGRSQMRVGLGPGVTPTLQLDLQQDAIPAYLKDDAFLSRSVFATGSVSP